LADLVLPRQGPMLQVCRRRAFLASVALAACEDGRQASAPTAPRVSVPHAGDTPSTATTNTVPAARPPAAAARPPAAAAHARRHRRAYLVDPHFKSFEKHVLPVLVKEHIGVLGMKPLGSGDILESGVVNAEDCLRNALSLPTSVVITGCDSMRILEQAIDIARRFKPLHDAERRALLDKTAPPTKPVSSRRSKPASVSTPRARIRTG